NSLLDKIEGDNVELETRELDHVDYIIAPEITDEMLTTQSTLIVEVMDESYHQADIQGIAIVNENGNYYIPTTVALQSDSFKKWAKDEANLKTVYDGKKSIVALRWKGVELAGIDFDCLI